MTKNKNQYNIEFVVISGPLLFDIYILFNLFYLSECTEVFNVADGMTFY